MVELKRWQCFSINEWKEFYREKTGDEFKTRQGFKELYIPDRGLCQLSITEKIVVVEQVSGDGKYWKSVAEVIAQILGIDIIGTLLTRRNPEAYMRLFGYEIEDIDERNGEKKYFGRNKQTGLKCWLTPAEERTSQGHRIYFVTWEVRRNVENQRNSATNQSSNTR